MGVQDLVLVPSAYGTRSRDMFDLAQAQPRLEDASAWLAIVSDDSVARPAIPGASIAGAMTTVASVLRRSIFPGGHSESSMLVRHKYTTLSAGKHTEHARDSHARQ